MKGAAQIKPSRRSEGARSALRADRVLTKDVVSRVGRRRFDGKGQCAGFPSTAPLYCRWPRHDVCVGGLRTTRTGRCLFVRQICGVSILSTSHRPGKRRCAMARQEICSKCGSKNIDTRAADFSTKMGVALRNGGLLGATVFLPLTALVAAVYQTEVYVCRDCGHEWHYG